jgi:hypothetical protein
MFMRGVRELSTGTVRASLGGQLIHYINLKLAINNLVKIIKYCCFRFKKITLKVDILRFFKFNALTVSDLRKVNALKVNEFSLLKKLILSAS